MSKLSDWLKSFLQLTVRNTYTNTHIYNNKPATPRQIKEMKEFEQDFDDMVKHMDDMFTHRGKE